VPEFVESEVKQMVDMKLEAEARLKNDTTDYTDTATKPAAKAYVILGQDSGGKGGRYGPNGAVSSSVQGLQGQGQGGNKFSGRYASRAKGGGARSVASLEVNESAHRLVAAAKLESIEKRNRIKLEQ
jgi:hypothetical protein